MTPKKFAVLAMTGLLSVTAAASVFADTPMTADQAVAARQAAMKSDGKALKGSDGFTGDKAIAALTEVQKNYTKLPSLFVKDSITSKSIALPIIWQQFDDFSAIFKKGADAAAVGIAAVKAGDTVGYQTAIKTIASTCNECHNTYREKKDG